MSLYTGTTPEPGAMGSDQDTARWTELVFDLEPDGDDVPILLIQFGSTPYDTLALYDGSAFSPLFAEHSSVEVSGLPS